MNKIEQVARAIAPDLWESFDNHCGIKRWNDEEVAVAKANNSSIRKTIWQARAAIEAMREPTDAMVESGFDYDERELKIRLGRAPTPEECQAAEYSAMIDAALRGE